jgi:hypothetical protein
MLRVDEQQLRGVEDVGVAADLIGGDADLLGDVLVLIRVPFV